MSFISDSLLLNLPFHQPLKEDPTQWPDERHQELTAIAENCESSTLDFLGSCLKIKAGGKLTLPDQIRTQITSAIQHQLTVEFWAEPAPEALGEERQQYLLKGPVTIWMQGNYLHWFVDKSSSEQSHQIEGVVGLHHWAIVINRTVNSAQITFFKDGVEITDPAETILIPESLKSESQVATANLVIGAEEQGWTGKLAHLRIWKTALRTVDLEHNMQRDIMAAAAFKATTGVEWRLVNADDEPALYIHSNGPQELRLEIENATKETILSIPKSSEETASQDNYHFYLVFRPGTITSPLLTNSTADPFKVAVGSIQNNPLIKAIRAKNPGWSVNLGQQNEQDCIYFLRTGLAILLNPRTRQEQSANKRLTLLIPGVAAVPGSGSRPTEVGLHYNQIKIEGSERFLDGHRAQRLNILYREPSLRQPPLEVGVVGAPVVLNNGEATCLTIYIKNRNGNEDDAATPLILGAANGVNDVQPKFFLKIDTLTAFVETQSREVKQGDKFCLKKTDPKTNTVFAEGNAYKFEKEESGKWQVKNLKTDQMESIDPPGEILKIGSASIDAKGLGDFDDLMNIALNLEHEQFGISKPVASGSIISWEIAPKVNTNHEVSLKANETLLLSLSGLKTTAPPGHSVLRLCYEDFDRYGEGEFEIPIDRGSVIPAKVKGDRTGYGLAIGHDPRVGKTDPNADALDDLLFVKKVEGNGAVVRIENTGSGTGLTVVQGSNNTDISQGLSLHLRLDDSNIQDLSANNCDCTVENSPQVITDPQLGKCRHFSGNETITCSGINLANSSFTIQFWAKREAVQNSNGFIVGQEQDGLAASNRDYKSLHIGFREPNYDEDKFTFAFWNKDLNVPNQNDTDWHHWACVYNLIQKKQFIYKDGQEVGQQSDTNTSYQGSGDFVIGQVKRREGFKGNLADLRVHTRALSPKEILLCKGAIAKEKEAATAAVHIEKSNIGTGLLVDQNGNGLAAKFNGGSGVEITGNLQVGQRIRDKTGVIMPVGAVLPFAGAVAPEGWLLCNGQRVSDPKYADLAEVLGQMLPFNVPDYRERFIAGATGTGDYVLGNTDGHEKVALEISEMPNHQHNHSLNVERGGGHSHTVQVFRGSGPSGTAENIDSTTARQHYVTKSVDGDGEHAHVVKGSIDFTGGSEEGKTKPHENRPPFVALNYIIKY